MNDYLRLSEDEYFFLKKLSNFPKRFDGWRYKFGCLLEGDEIEIAHDLQKDGYVFLGAKPIALYDKASVLETASITPYGEYVFKLNKEKREYNPFLLFFIEFWRSFGSIDCR